MSIAAFKTEDSSSPLTYEKRESFSSPSSEPESSSLISNVSTFPFLFFPICYYIFPFFSRILTRDYPTLLFYFSLIILFFTSSTMGNNFFAVLSK
jgi:hypothetical protein